MKNVDRTKLIPVSLMAGEDNEETEQLQGLYIEARRYIESFKWCDSVKAVHFGIGVADIIAVFLFEITPNSQEVDSTIWVIVGDIPPAYLVIDHALNPARALSLYTKEMEAWVNAVLSRRSIHGIIPVNAPPTTENAVNLKKRLDFINEEILSSYSEDLN